jgi:predicted DNA-binding protein
MEINMAENVTPFLVRLTQDNVTRLNKGKVALRESKASIINKAIEHYLADKINAPHR